MDLNNMDQLPISQKVIRNTIFNAIGSFWQILIGLILIPYIVSHIGMERYGIWAIVGVLTGYFGLLDLGVKDSFTKYIAEFYAKEDDKSINEVVNVGFVFYSLLALVVVAVGFFSVDPLIRLFKIPDNLHDETSFVFLLGIIVFAASNVVNVFAAIQSGLQRMDISNKVVVAISFPNAIGTVVFLQLGYGLPGLMVNSAIIMGIRGIIHILIAFKILPTFRFNPFVFNKRIFKMLSGFGVKRWVARIEEIVTYQTDKLLISRFLNVSLVGYYELGFSIVIRARGLLMLITSAIVPAASELDAKKAKEQIVRLYLRGGKYLLMVGTPAMVFLLVTALYIMLAWMGTGYEKSELVIQVLSLAVLVAFHSGMGATVAIGIGRPDFQMKAGGGQTILNLILSIILVVKIGFVGVMLATLISFLFSTTYLLKMIHVHLKLPLAMFIRKATLKPLIVSFMLGTVIYLVNFGLGRYLPLNRFSCLGLLMFDVILFFISYLLILLRVNFIDVKDRTLFRDILLLKIFRRQIAKQCKEKGRL